MGDGATPIAVPAKAGSRLSVDRERGGWSRLSRGPRQLFGSWCAALLIVSVAAPALAQKSGGTLRIPFVTSPASMSIHEESTIVVLGPMMGVFNNLVMFDQHVSQSGLNTIVPDLATEWSWNEEHTTLTFRLRPGVPVAADRYSCPQVSAVPCRRRSGMARTCGRRRNVPGLPRRVPEDAGDRLTCRYLLNHDL